MSTEETSVYSIKCTNCAAPLNILGGGRVTTITCEYCNSILDISDHYKVVAQFQDKYRPSVPFKLGMQGKIKDVEWIIIGWVSYIDSDGEQWSEFFLYSALYGYGWLIYEDGNLSFSKRVRDFNLREWQDKKNPKALFYKQGHYLAKEESYIARINFVQGELSWVAKADDKVRCWDYDGVNRKSLSIEKTNNEIEVYLNEKLDAAQVYNSFGVKKDNQVKAKQSFAEKLVEEDSLDETEKATDIFISGIKWLLFTLIFAVVFSFFSGTHVISVNNDGRPFSQDITIKNSGFLTKINIKGSSAYALEHHSFSIYQNDKKLFSVDKDRVYYSKKMLGSTWNKKSINATIYLKLDKGKYRVELSPYPKTLKGIQKGSVFVTIQEGVARLVYLLPLLITLLAIFIYFSMKSGFKGNKSILYILGTGLGVWIFGLGVLILIGIGYLFFKQLEKDGNWGDSGDE